MLKLCLPLCSTVIMLILLAAIFVLHIACIIILLTATIDNVSAILVVCCIDFFHAQGIIAPALLLASSLSFRPCASLTWWMGKELRLIHLLRNSFLLGVRPAVLLDGHMFDISVRYMVTSSVSSPHTAERLIQIRHTSTDTYMRVSPALQPLLHTWVRFVSVKGTSEFLLHIVIISPCKCTP